MEKLLIAGLGNELLKDDGVGVHVVRALQIRAQTQLMEDVQLAEIGTAIMSYLYILESSTKILVLDAMQAGQAPGTIYRAKIEQLIDNPVPLTLHQLSLVGAFHLLENTKRPQIDIIGVEPEIIDYGLDLSPVVQSTLPKVIEHAEQWVLGLRLAVNSSQTATR